MKTLISFSITLLIVTCNLTAQNIGIGTLTPHPNATLQVLAPANNGLLVNGTLDVAATIPDLGAGSRLMFFPGKGIFRAGVVTGTAWNDINTGVYSCAIGFNTIAYGIASMSVGNQTVASGNFSAAIGLFTRAFSAGEVAIGSFNTSYSPAPGNIWMGTDRVFAIGNGSSIDDLSDAMVVLKNGNVGLGYSAPVEKLQVNGSGLVNGILTVIGDATVLGFTRMGGNSTSVPKIKMKKLTGTSSNTQGTWVNVAHGLTASKIIAVNILMDVPGFVNLPPNYTFNATYEYQYQVSTTNIVVLNAAANSAGILSKAFRILITYEE